jgi:hypothetical protein
LNVWEILVRPVRPFEEPRYQEVMQAHHYPGSLPKIGETLWYDATWNNQRWNETYAEKDESLVLQRRLVRKPPLKWRILIESPKHSCPIYRK